MPLRMEEVGLLWKMNCGSRIERHERRCWRRRATAQFFVDWVRERMARIKVSDQMQKQEVMLPQLRAEKFWQERVGKANAE